MPFTKVEVNAYCASQLFPLLPSNSLSMPGRVRRALDETKGIVGKLSEVVKREGGNISMALPPTVSSTRKPFFIVLGLAMSLVAIGLVLHFLPMKSVNEWLPENINNEPSSHAESIESKATEPASNIVRKDTMAKEVNIVIEPQAAKLTKAPFSVISEVIDKVEEQPLSEKIKDQSIEVSLSERIPEANVLDTANQKSNSPVS
jgi:hypothetical protein